MGQIQLLAEVHGQRLQQARQLFFDQGTLPEGLVDPLILRSWERCRRFGLAELSLTPATEAMDRVALKTEQDRNRYLLMQGRPIMEHVFEQIRDSGSMVILADANGLLLETVGDPEFVNRADRVALSAGASWDENLRGTNAIGTALSEEAPVAVLGGEHFIEHNGFLTCCASPIFGPDGRLIGVLDISGDYRSHQRHTLGLVRLSSAIVEKRLFESIHARDILVCFHSRPDYLGSPKEGIAAVSPDGQVLAINRNGTDILGIRQVDAVRRDFSMVFENNLSALVDRLRHNPQGTCEINVGGKVINIQLRGQLPPLAVAGRVFDEPPAQRAPRRPEASGSATPTLTLDTLNTGDPRMQAAIDRARRMLGRDIPILIQGESGAGKEMFAKGFHNSGPRRDAPFVALNCASIPETLIESELFGYQGGAFTGARKEGAPGKIQQAHGGTLFLDEIGDMPLNLQARLLRVLQERCVTPLGSTRSIQVDISLVCATHRKLREEVARGSFREDLYYRLNGMSVTLPALRERTDIRSMVAKLAAVEIAARGGPVSFSEGALRAIEQYGWPGNIRQLFNVIRVAIALLDDDETLITESHLPEELFESSPLAPTSSAPVYDPWAAAPLEGANSMDAISRQAAMRALESAGGNISSAARQLGISRNTLYRKLGRM
ncbi:sigma-54-dependent Fis family transcriptional regulator [Ferribacterium limneticum]|uniref:sigma-54-dependent Fis family transcriptional regulator n=1 Tax=Ferribacterium limneticum TaxID=76259 RepID=UPI001CFC2093|nr:sigma-54-dependent Fis family transcriptional regulator [Ferribacterium limneticum]UCV27415.1 sigma-54-dependent Fis family transcriptional regulator [Ferribacterium limneticum]UCV31332.1 sigma-54-dependent Fis family transcriptional regulator [Ferribacterium limneticum]